jgi:hypothetical protein
MFRALTDDRKTGLAESVEADYAAHLEDYKAQHAAWKTAVEKAKKKGKTARRFTRSYRPKVLSQSRRPPALVVSDASPEALTLFLTEYRPYGGLFSDEGGKMLGGYAMSNDSKTKTAALLNDLWGGAPITRLRVLTGNAFAPGRRFSTHLMVQPMISEMLLNDAGLVDIGLLPRMLVVSPESTIGTLFFQEADPVCDMVLKDYGRQMARFLDKEPPVREGGNGLDPVHLPMSAEARKILVSFHDEVEGRNAPRFLGTAPCERPSNGRGAASPWIRRRAYHPPRFSRSGRQRCPACNCLARVLGRRGGSGRSWRRR